MNFIKKTLEYLFVLERGKRFLLLFALSLPVGFALIFMIPNWRYADWIINFRVGNYNFLQAWTFNHPNLTFPIATVFFFFVALFFTSVQTSIITRSIRVGRFKLTNLMAEFNEGFYPTFFALLLYAVMFLIYKTLITLFIVLWQIISTPITALIITLATVILITFCGAIAVSFSISFLPIMAFEGINPKNALSSSIQKCSKNMRGLTLAIALPIIINTAINFAIYFTNNLLFSLIVSGITHSFMICYFVTFFNIAYTELEGTKREDYPREYYFRRRR